MLLFLVLPSCSKKEIILASQCQVCSEDMNVYSPDFIYLTQQYPQMKAPDLYKWLHQSIFGVGHLIGDPQQARKYLIEEMAEIGAQPLSGEPCMELLTPTLLRVNLRPYQAAGGKPQPLFTAMLFTARNVHGSKEMMDAAIKAARESWPPGGLKFSLEEFLQLAGEMKGKGYPQLHHSQIYTEKYKPAYRVISADGWPGLADRLPAFGTTPVINCSPLGL